MYNTYGKFSAEGPISGPYVLEKKMWAAVPTAVECHGLSVKYRNVLMPSPWGKRVTIWQHAVWGYPEEGLLGRAPLAIIEAIKRDAELMIWGSGASKEGELFESQVTFRHALKHIDEIMDFIEYPRSVPRVRQRLEHISELDLTSRNTAEEARFALRRCRERGIKEVYAATTATHIERSMRDFLAEAESELGTGIRIYGTHSDTLYPGTSVRDVAILEPGEYPECGKPAFNEIAQRLLRFYAEPKIAGMLIADLDKVLRVYENST